MKTATCLIVLTFGMTSALALEVQNSNTGLTPQEVQAATFPGLTDGVLVDASGNPIAIEAAGGTLGTTVNPFTNTTVIAPAGTATATPSFPGMQTLTTGVFRTTTGELPSANPYAGRANGFPNIGLGTPTTTTPTGTLSGSASVGAPSAVAAPTPSAVIPAHPR